LSRLAILGVDVGGTSIKAALVSEDGALHSKRLEVPTPQPATPRAVAQALQTIITGFRVDGTVGIAFPAPIINSIVMSPANVADGWIGLAGEGFLETVLRRPVKLINDADAAGLAEGQLGAARGVGGLVLMLTLGTGIGSAILHDGHLIPNTELGLTPFRESDIEQYAAPSVMRRGGIGESEWTKRFSEVITLFERLLRPDLIIVSGGITARWSDIANFVKCRVPLVPAHFQDDAGIIGASIFARSGGLTKPQLPQRLTISEPGY